MNVKIFIAMLGFVGVQLYAQSDKVYHIERGILGLAQVWEQGIERGIMFEDDFWLGYGILRRTSRHSSISSHHSQSRYQSLQQLLYGDSSARFTDATELSGSDIVNKELAIVMRINQKGDIRDVKISDLDGRMDLKQLPVIWCGLFEHHSESFQLLKDIYSKSEEQEVREDLIVAISLHQLKPEIMGFLTDVIENESDREIRAEAVFWLGQQDDAGVATYLYQLAMNDPDEEIRGKAIFSLSQVESDEAVDYVIELAKSARDPELRKNAIFWLGQMASERTNNTLEEIVYDEHDLELKEQAVFALSQLPENGGVSPLIKIATEHESAQIRKKAIFWLGQTEDPRALEVIISLLKDK